MLTPYSRPADRAGRILHWTLRRADGEYLFVDIYEAYRQGCRQHEVPVETRQAVGIALHQMGHHRVRRGKDTTWLIKPLSLP